MALGATCVKRCERSEVSEACVVVATVTAAHAFSIRASSLDEQAAVELEHHGVGVVSRLSHHEFVRVSLI